MPQPPETRQNRLKIISLFIFCVAVILSIQWMIPKKPATATTPSPVTVVSDEEALYIGIRKPTASEIYQSLPEAKGKPLVVMFHSRFCLDCKKMTPILQRLIPTYPSVLYRTFDIMQDAHNNPGVFNTFRPVTVPVLVFVTPAGAIQNVLYNEQSEQTVATALQTVSQNAGKPPAAKKIPKKIQ